MEDGAKSLGGTEVTKILEECIQLLAKSKRETIIDLIKKYDAGIDLPASAALELLIRAALDTVWKAKGEDWDLIRQVFQQELSGAIADTDLWMKAAVAAANALTVSRPKEIIRTQDGVMPKGKANKSEYVALAIDAVRSKNNDFQYVTEFMRSQGADSKKIKGFGKKL